MMIHAQILSIQIGQARQYETAGDPRESWTSAIVKTAVSKPVHVGLNGIDGDQQADLVHHGGADKAVLAYSEKHYALWNTEFPDMNFQAGGFGENLTVAGIDESACCIGDIFRVGECLLQISQPRQPCWKLSRLWNLPKLAVLVQQNGRSGWYHRVLLEGIIHTGMAVELMDRPYPDLTVAWASSVMFAAPRCSGDDLKLAACPALSVSWQTTLRNRALRGTERPASERLFGSESQVND